MGMTDPIADMFTRIRNGLGVKSDIVEIQHSGIKERIAQILLNEGFLGGYEIGGAGIQRKLFIKLKYAEDLRPVINEIKRVSKPGRRIYVGKDELPRVTSGFGIAILSTPKGLMTNVQAKKAGVGGELIGTVW